MNTGRANKLLAHSLHSLYVGENAEEQEWQPGPMTTQAKNHFRDMVDDLMQELKNLTEI